MTINKRIERGINGSGAYSDVAVKVTDESQHVYVDPVLANERGRGTSAACGASNPEANATVVDYSADGDTDVSSSAPAKLLGVYVNTANSHAIQIRDATTAGGGTLLYTIPASVAAGTRIEFPGVKFNTALFVDWNASETTGNVTIEWWAQP